MVPLMWVTWCWKTGMREYFSLYIFSYLVVKPFKWITYQKHFKQFVFPPFLNCLFIWFHHFAGGLLVFFILTLKKAPQSKKIVYFSIRYIADIFTQFVFGFLLHLCICLEICLVEPFKFYVVKNTNAINPHYSQTLYLPLHLIAKIYSQCPSLYWQRMCVKLYTETHMKQGQLLIS